MWSILGVKTFTRRQPWIGEFWQSYWRWSRSLWPSASERSSIRPGWPAAWPSRGRSPRVLRTFLPTGTREELAAAVAKRTRRPKLRAVLRSGWGSLLKPSAHQDDLCFGPSRGQSVTFVRPSEWIGIWRPVKPDQAFKEMARRYLTAYGPATVEDFAHWWGVEPSIARPLFRSFGDELEAVDVEGWKAWALASTIPKMRKVKEVRSVRLPPNFDPYTIAVSPHSRSLISLDHRARVYRTKGAWISPVVLVDGRMEGVWAADRRKSRATVTVEMFAPPAPRITRGIQAEVKRLARFLGHQDRAADHDLTRLRAGRRGRP
ncbi:MAG: crosslink repair DNA glycosylase YcaQ family protein [Candidatus Omnitrophota bacterium]|nr:crosslink repair DNA glycosylase YcaQ family protein [Candidatus Omnitrophota bacterium]